MAVIVSIKFLSVSPDKLDSLTGTNLIDCLILNAVNEGHSSLPWGYIICKDGHLFQLIESNPDISSILIVYPHSHYSHTRNQAPSEVLPPDIMILLNQALSKIQSSFGSIISVNVDERSEWLKQKIPDMLRELKRTQLTI